LYSSKKTTLLVADPHHPVLDMDVVALFIHLTDADEVGVEARDVVDSVEAAVLPILVGEQNHLASLDLDHRAVAEPHHLDHAVVELGEDSPRPGHVISRACVEVPELAVDAPPPSICAKTLASSSSTGRPPT
jgi:hypothetical protein